jgi:hypothetical protein
VTPPHAAIEIGDQGAVLKHRTVLADKLYAEVGASK